MPLFYISATLGFSLLYLADHLRVRLKHQYSKFSSVTGYILVGSTVLSSIMRGSSPPAPNLRATAGFLLFLASVSMLVYSVFIEIPLIRRRKSIPHNHAVTSGTYGFSRHPGFLWFAAMQAGLVLMNGGNLACFALYSTLLDLILVWIQDRFFFPKYFINYNEYTEKVPFLVLFS